jgi:hypothetical protein
MDAYRSTPTAVRSEDGALGAANADQHSGPMSSNRTLQIEALDLTPAGDLERAVEDLTAAVLHAVRHGIDARDIEVVENDDIWRPLGASTLGQLSR